MSYAILIFNSKLRDPSNKITPFPTKIQISDPPPPPAKTSLKIFNSLQAGGGRGGCMPWLLPSSVKVLLRINRSYFKFVYGLSMKLPETHIIFPKQGMAF